MSVNVWRLNSGHCHVVWLQSGRKLIIQFERNIFSKRQNSVYLWILVMNTNCILVGLSIYFSFAHHFVQILENTKTFVILNIKRSGELLTISYFSWKTTKKGWNWCWFPHIRLQCLEIFFVNSQLFFRIFKIYTHFPDTCFAHCFVVFLVSFCYELSHLRKSGFCTVSGNHL